MSIKLDIINKVVNSYNSNNYFFEYKENKNHPHMSFTGTEGRCGLCGKGSNNNIHKEPFTKTFIKK